MGNQAGKTADQQAQYGGIFVKLDAEAFNPNDTLKGTIYLDLKAPYPGDKICLEVKGSEFTKWIEKEARQRPSTNPQDPPGTMETYYVDVQREATREVISNDLTVYDWIGKTTVPPGQYTFPFAFQIPPGLPGSFFFQRGNCVAEIKYSVEGYLKPEVESVPRLKHKLYLTMREEMQKNIQTKELTLSKPLTTWCCISQGTINLRTAFEKDAYAPGEEARMLTEIDNSKCGLNVDHVVFQLSQTIDINDGKNHGRHFSFPIRTINLGTIPAGQSCIGENRKSASIMLPPGQEGKAKDFGQATYQDPDPTQFITPSSHGKLVKSDFTLSLTCSVEGCLCCDSVPGVATPIQVYAAIKARQPDPIPPPNWNPTPMPPANLTITIVQLANGGQEIHIEMGDQGGANTGMAGNQMPPQPQPQQGFAQPNQQMQPQMQPAKPDQFNTSQQPLMNNSMNTSGYPQQQPMNTGYPQQQQPIPQQQPMNTGYPQQQQQQPYPQQQPMNTGYPQQQQYPPQQQYPQQQPMNTGYPQQQQQPVYGQQQPQMLNAQPVQIGQNPQYQQPHY